MNKKIFWISSYPKSGNTWVRAIIASLYFTENGIFNFEILKKIQTFDNIKYFQFINKINPDDFNNLSNINIMSKYWHESQKKIYAGGDFMFLKTHHARIKLLNNFFTTPELSRALIYIIRDPRDVLISSAKFHGNDIDKELTKLITSSFLNYNDFSKILEHKEKPLVPLLNWGKHINSWLNLETPKLIIKYEDILLNTKNIIISIVNFIKNKIGIIPTNLEQKIVNIITTTSFISLQKKEKDTGFPESSNNSNFFRSGKKNQWEQLLNKEQIAIIEKKFNKEMKLFNYL